MNRAEIIYTQERIGTTPDGFWGPKSIAACKKHLRDHMPSPNPWPKADQASVTKVFGPPGESRIISVPTPVPMYLYDSTTRVKRIRCHEAVAQSLCRALKSAFDVHPDVVARYFGCYDYRNSRGANSLSKHAWGIAVDLDATSNAFKSSWPMRAKMPILVMECFAMEGWTAAGAFWGYDAMHFQATAP